MKYLIIPILLISLTALNFLSEKIENFNNSEPKNELNFVESVGKKNFDSIFDKQKIAMIETPTVYFCDLQFQTNKNIISVKSKITWKNLTEFPAKNLYFNFERIINKSSNRIRGDKNRKISVNNYSCSKKSSGLIFGDKNSRNKEGNFARIVFDDPILIGDSVTFIIEYKLPISSSFDSLNYTENKQIFIDDEWYPRIPIFKNGKWKIYPKSPFTRELRSFADFNLNISAPKNFKFITTGKIVDKKIKGKYQVLKVAQNRVSDFAIIAVKNIKLSNRKYQLFNNNELTIFIPAKYKEYSKRIKKAANNSLTFLSKKIGKYSYQNISILYLPHISKNTYSSFSKVILLSSDIFLSDDSYDFEESAAQKIAEQYFHFITNNNSQTEAWLSHGISKYVAEKIKLKYYKNSQATFKFLKYIHVNGLQFLSYKGIPLIYTLGDYPIVPEALSLKDYYTDYLSGSISDSSYLFVDKNSYSINSIQKPFLMLLSLERIVGKSKMENILHQYYSKYHFCNTTSKTLFGIIKKKTTAYTLHYLNQIYNGYDYYDLKIKKLKKMKENKYELTLESNGHCKLITDIFVYTNADTLKFKWNTADKWKVIRFTSDKIILAAEIDPTHKFIFDSNYSNNSFTIDRMNWAAISISIRWLFWIQNAIMILGSSA